MPTPRKRKIAVVDPAQRKLTAFGFSTSRVLSVVESAPVPGAVSLESADAASNDALQSAASAPVTCTKCHGPATPQSKRQLSSRQHLQKRKRGKLAEPHDLPLYKDSGTPKASQEDRKRPKVVQKSAAIKERDSRLLTGYQRRHADLFGLSHADLQPALGSPASSAAAPHPAEASKAAFPGTVDRFPLQPGPSAAIQQTADLLAHPLPVLYAQPQQLQGLPSPVHATDAPADEAALQPLGGSAGALPALDSGAEGPLAALEDVDLALTQEEEQALLEWESRRNTLAASTSGRAIGSAGEGSLAALEEVDLALTQEEELALLEWERRRNSLAASTSGRAPQQMPSKRQLSAASLAHGFPDNLLASRMDVATHNLAAVFAGSFAAASSAGVGGRGPTAVAALPPQPSRPPQSGPSHFPPSPGSNGTAMLSHAGPQMPMGGPGLQQRAPPSLQAQLPGSCQPGLAAPPIVRRAGFSRQTIASLASSSNSQGAGQPQGTQQPGLPATAASRRNGADNRLHAAEQPEPLRRHGSQPRDPPAPQPAVRPKVAFPVGLRQQRAAGDAQLHQLAAPQVPAQERVDHVPGQAAHAAPVAVPQDPWEASLMPRQQHAESQGAWQNPDPRRALELMRALPLNKEQMAAASSDPDLPKMIRAGAGTGKTTTIIGRILYYTLGKGISPRHILALTFTNKAAKELKDRLAARGVRDVRVSTFHALCNTVLSEFYVEAGFTKRPLIWSSPAELRAVLAEAMRWASLTKGKDRIITWLDLDKRGLGQSWDDLLAAIKEKDPRLFLKAEEDAAKVMSKSKAKLKKEEQARKEAEENGDVEDAEQGGMSPDKRGWKEATLNRVSQLELIQKVYEALLKRHHPELWEDQYGKKAEDRKKKKSKKPDNVPPYNFTPPGEMPPKAAVTQTFKWLERVKGRGLPPQAFQSYEGVAYSNYQRLLREAAAVDFGDLLIHVRDLLQDKAVCAKLQARYKYRLVDEYQDSNLLQIGMLDALQLESQRVTVVGDDYQAIYGFRGAQPDVFQKFIDVYDHPQLQQSLQDNYRSRPAIVDTGVMVMDNAVGVLRKTLRATKDANEHKPQLWETGHPVQEAAGILREIKRLHKEDGVPYENMACLFRVFNPGKAPKTYEPLQKELLDNEVPFNIVKVVAFMDRVEVKDALAYLRLMLNTRDDPAFERVFNKPKRGLGAKFREELKAYQEQKRQTAFYKDEAENTGEEAADCSLMQCCQKMLDAGLLVNRFASGAREFVAFINKMRLESLHWTPSQTLMHLLVDSGYLAEYKKAKAKQREDAEHNPLATSIPDPKEDDSNLPLSYTPKQAAAEDEEEVAAEEAAHGTDDDAKAAEGAGQGSTDQAGNEDEDPVLNTKLPEGPLLELLAMTRDFEASYLPGLDIDPETHRPTQESSTGVETLLRMSERAVVEGDPASAAEELPHDMLLSSYASFKKGPLPLMGLLDRFSLSSDQDEVGKKPGVTICTIHAAKGLEWDVVFVPRLNQGFLPTSWRPEGGPLATGTERLEVPQFFNSFNVLEEWGGRHRPARQMTDLEKACMLHFEEERRLLHVAITRARERAYISYVRSSFSKDKKQWYQLERSYFMSSIVSSMRFTVFAKDEDEKQAEREDRFRPGLGSW